MDSVFSEERIFGSYEAAANEEYPYTAVRQFKYIEPIENKKLTNIRNDEWECLFNVRDIPDEIPPKKSFFPNVVDLWFKKKDDPEKRFCEQIVMKYVGYNKFTLSILNFVYTTKNNNYRSANEIPITFNQLKTIRDSGGYVLVQLFHPNQEEKEKIVGFDHPLIIMGIVKPKTIIPVGRIPFSNFRIRLHPNYLRELAVRTHYSRFGSRRERPERVLAIAEPKKESEIVDNEPNN